MPGRQLDLEPNLAWAGQPRQPWGGLPPGPLTAPDPVGMTAPRSGIHTAPGIEDGALHERTPELRPGSPGAPGLARQSELESARRSKVEITPL